MEIADIKKIGVAGTGTMGAGIIQMLARKGFKVIATDLKEDYLDRGKHLISIFNDSLIEEGLMDRKEVAHIDENVHYSLDNSLLAQCDIIIEAIIENIQLKQDFWEEVEKTAREDAIFITNTSGLSITGIAKKVKRKNRLIGMHLWNPPHIIPLVELIRGEGTDDATVELVRELTKIIEKKPVVVQRDAPGFIGNRLQFAAFREALNIVESGIASPEDVDTAMKYGPGFRYPIIGPLETADLGGLDTFFYISDYLFEDLSDVKKPQKLLTDLMEKKELGVKSKKGIYDYSGGRDEEVIKRRDKLFFKMLKLISEE